MDDLGVPPIMKPYIIPIYFHFFKRISPHWSFATPITGPMFNILGPQIWDVNPYFLFISNTRWQKNSWLWKNTILRGLQTGHLYHSHVSLPEGIYPGDIGFPQDRSKSDITYTFYHRERSSHLKVEQSRI